MQQRRSRSVWTVVVGIVLAPGCSGTSECKHFDTLEFGVLDNEDAFSPFAAGAPLPITAMMSAYGLVFSLRTQGIHPMAAVPHIEVTIQDQTVGANLTTAAVDLVPQGDRYVLENLGVLFQVDPCCFNCSEATITGSLTDTACAQSTGQLTVTVVGGGSCPPATHCGCAASTCPAPFVPVACVP